MSSSNGDRWRTDGELKAYIDALEEKLSKKKKASEENETTKKEFLSVPEQDQLEKDEQERVRLCQLKKLLKMSPKEYLDETVSPYLYIALEKVNKMRPPDPIASLAAYLIDSKSLMDEIIKPKPHN